MKKWNLKQIDTKTGIILTCAFVEVFIIILSLYIKAVEKCFDITILKGAENIFNAPKIIIYNPGIIVIAIVVIAIGMLGFINVKNFLKGTNEEVEGIGFKEKDGTHGTANFSDVRELTDILTIGNEENTKGIIIGKTLDTDEIITLPDIYKDLNRNIFVIGASGSGKSRKFLIPNILKIAEQDEKIENEIKKGKNIVCTDPKGDLYCKCCRILEKKGYKVKLFNLVAPLYSDGIDLIKFIETPLDAQIFAQVVITTTQDVGSKKGDEFWQTTQENLLKALLLHIVFEVEDESKKNMEYLYSIISSGDIKKVDMVFQKSKGITKIAYNIYAQATDSIKQSVITGLATKLQIFQLDEINAITQRNDIDFAELDNEKVAIFCVTSDMDTTMNFLNSLFFSFLFIKTIRIADNNKEKRLHRDLNVILDEFPNIGQIPDFPQKLATIRSRGISAMVACQNVSGLENLYPNNLWQSIIGNEDIKIIMGLNDILSAEYFSKVLGVSTVANNSIRKTAGFDGMMDIGKEGIATVSRNLMNADELLRLDNMIQIVIIRGQKAFKCKKFDYSEYRIANEMEEIEIAKYKKPITLERKNIKEELEKLPTFEEFIKSKRKEG